MTKRRYGVMISAAALVLQLAGNAGAQVPFPELEELEVISELLDANDVSGLRTYLASKPELLQGDSDLALLLREYMEQSEDLAAFLGIPEEAAGDGSDSAGTVSRGAGIGIAAIY